MLKLKDMIELIKTDKIWFMDETAGYITGTIDNLYYEKINVMNAEVTKIEILAKNEMMITLQNWR